MNSRLIEISNNYTSVNDFIRDEEVKNIINDYRLNGINSNNYKEVITSLVNTLNLSFEDSNLLIDLFSTPSVLTVSSSKKYLRYKGALKWDFYRDKNNSLYDDLAIRICTFLKNDSFDKMILKYNSEIRDINYITGVSYDDILVLFKRYQDAYIKKDSTKLAIIYSDIRDLIQVFNSKSKEKFILDYVNNNLELIKDNFKCNNEAYSINNLLSIDSYLDISFNNSKYINNLKLYIENNFSISVFDDQLKEIMYDILKRNDKNNLEIFNIPNCSFRELKITRSYNRLCNNYSDDLNSKFTLEQVDLINKYIYSDNKKLLKVNFSKDQLSFLEKIIPIVRESKAYVMVSEKNLVFISNNILSEEDSDYLKKKETLSKGYKNFCNLIFSDYFKECNLRNKYLNTNKSCSSANLLFNDSNYYLTNSDYLLEFDLVAFILSNIDINIISKLREENNSYLKLKKFLIDDGLLACSLAYKDSGEDIYNIINNVFSVTDFNMNKLCSILKKAKLYKYIDDFTLSLLGEEVTSKIVFDVSFLVDGYNPVNIIDRINKANNLMLLASNITNSTIPYFDPIKIDHISLERYNNNDSSILTSGIDSNTCFKLSAIDNDYLFYSVLNKNGMVARIVDNGEMIGRITAHRNGNCLLINSIRSHDNRYQATCFEDLVRNDKIIELVKKFANTMIKLTTDTDLEIDYVVCNKAGILSSFEYDKYFPVVPDYFFKNPIDTYNEDFLEFEDLYCDFLQQVPFYENRNEAPFSSDYGNYPIVLISSRNNRMIERRFDISSKSAAAIYERENKIFKGVGKLPNSIVRKIQRIDAINYYNKGLDILKYSRIDYSNIDIKSYEVSDYYYLLVDKNDKIIYKSINSLTDYKKVLLK